MAACLSRFCAFFIPAPHTLHHQQATTEQSTHLSSSSSSSSSRTCQQVLGSQDCPRFFGNHGSVLEVGLQALWLVKKYPLWRQEISFDAACFDFFRNIIHEFLFCKSVWAQRWNQMENYVGIIGFNRSDAVRFENQYLHRIWWVKIVALKGVDSTPTVLYQRSCQLRDSGCWGITKILATILLELTQYRPNKDFCAEYGSK